MEEEGFENIFVSNDKVSGTRLTEISKKGREKCSSAKSTENWIECSIEFMKLTKMETLSFGRTTYVSSTYELSAQNKRSKSFDEKISLSICFMTKLAIGTDTGLPIGLPWA